MILVDKDVEWTGLKFSPDGKTILVSTNGSLIRLIDSFSGETLQTFTGHLNSKNIPLEASFSPDSQFVIARDAQRWVVRLGGRDQILEDTTSCLTPPVTLAPLAVAVWMVLAPLLKNS